MPSVSSIATAISAVQAAPTSADALHAITDKCVTHETRNACTSYATKSLATCCPTDAKCEAEKMADIFEYCHAVCGNSDYICDATRDFLEVNGEAAYLAARSEDKPVSDWYYQQLARPALENQHHMPDEFTMEKRAASLGSQLMLRLRDPQKGKYLDTPDDYELIVDEPRPVPKIAEHEKTPMYVEKEPKRAGKGQADSSSVSYASEGAAHNLDLAKQVANAMKIARPPRIKPMNRLHLSNGDPAAEETKLSNSETEENSELRTGGPVEDAGDYVTLYFDELGTTTQADASATSIPTPSSETLAATSPASREATASASATTSADILHRIRQKLNINAVANSTVRGNTTFTHPNQTFPAAPMANAGIRAYQPSVFNAFVMVAIVVALLI